VSHWHQRPRGATRCFPSGECLSVS